MPAPQGNKNARKRPEGTKRYNLKFHLTAAEFELIKQFTPDQRSKILVQALQLAQTETGKEGE